jgi:hypothetical protein
MRPLLATKHPFVCKRAGHHLKGSESLDTLRTDREDLVINPITLRRSYFRFALVGAGQRSARPFRRRQRPSHAPQSLASSVMPDCTTQPITRNGWHIIRTAARVIICAAATNRGFAIARTQVIRPFRSLRTAPNQRSLEKVRFRGPSRGCQAGSRMIKMAEDLASSRRVVRQDQTYK